jgi:hypothetical protein
MGTGPQRISKNSRPLVDSRFFRLFNFFFSSYKNKYKIVYSFMDLCSESNVFDVINTDDIIKGFASQKERKNDLYK